MRFLILTPVGSIVHHNFAHSIKTTTRKFPDCDWLSNAGVSDIYTGRDALLESFVRLTHFGIALWIDSDESWSPSDIEAVTAPIAAGEMEVVAAPYAAKTRAKKRYNCALRLEDCDVEKGYVGPRKQVGGRDYVRIAYSGTGFLAMSRAAVMRARAAVRTYKSAVTKTVIPAVFDRIFLDDSRFGEDYGACHVLGQSGVELWLALGTSVIHYDGLQAFDTNEFDIDMNARWQASNKREGT